MSFRSRIDYFEEQKTLQGCQLPLKIFFLIVFVVAIKFGDIFFLSKFGGHPVFLTPYKRCEKHVIERPAYVSIFI
jgi:hypothetical protein